MGKFLAGVIVGLVAYEAAYYWGYKKTVTTDKGLDMPKEQDCGCQYVKDKYQAVNGILGKRKTAIV